MREHSIVTPSPSPPHPSVALSLSKPSSSPYPSSCPNLSRSGSHDSLDLDTLSASPRLSITLRGVGGGRWGGRLLEVESFRMLWGVGWDGKKIPHSQRGNNHGSSSVRTPSLLQAGPPCKTAPSKKALHANPPVKHMVPSTPSGKKAPVKTNPAAITVKGKARMNLTWTENMIINLYAARQEHLTEYTIGNVPAKGAWKLVLETWKELVQDDNDPDMMIMLATIEVETKNLANKWATVDKDAKAYILKGGTNKRGVEALPEPKCLFDFFEGGGVANVHWACIATNFPTDAISDAVDVNGPAEHHHLDFIQSDSLTLPLQKRKESHAGAVTQDELVFRADNEMEDDNEDGFFGNEIEGGDEPHGTADCPRPLERHLTPKTNLDDILVEASSTSDTATMGGYKEQDNYHCRGQEKGKEGPAHPVEDAYTRDPRLKKLKPTGPDTRAVNNELINPGQRVSKGKTPIKKSDWAKIASAKASAKAQVKILQMKMQHDLELAKLHLQNKHQMAQDKIKADQQSAWYKCIQPAGIDFASRAFVMGGATE
ncbi:hypothetical protein BDK51DRAFT_32826 [Blyttiomyces helicus]|uniref:No apical meristem-associated C-terminal domain-containing protein n=1 Tax=Blyttiomyces helicus TaxID=388810 RepID=A0A4P9WFF7_9FUNG|nr:hypothetical protein BDK51DRAFT_32826 [Blyttiomyces helicus]|eukprot:RKO91481.1 hypothetical protein BDK51DRAFT_32826 [Blyttiomyces helicus]